MKFRLPNRNTGRLGLAPDRREYDLPFHDDSANRFLTLLIGLMTFLAILSAAAGMALTSMADRWTSGLQGQMTAEIPAVDTLGVRLTDEQMQIMVKSVQNALASDPAVRDVTVKSGADTAKLVAPWLGAGEQVLGQVPLPTLVTISSGANDPETARRIEDKLAQVSPAIRLETHQSWLRDVLRLTDTLSFAAYLIGIITAVTTVSAVAGAVRARMAAYHEQLEILHLIGAADEYITRQFQKHALQISFIGAACGFAAAMATLLVIDMISGAGQGTLVPSLILSGFSFLFLLMIPAITCLITVLTTRIAVVKSLEDMP